MESSTRSTKRERSFFYDREHRLFWRQIFTFMKQYVFAIVFQGSPKSVPRYIVLKLCLNKHDMIQSCAYSDILYSDKETRICNWKRRSHLSFSKTWSFEASFSRILQHGRNERGCFPAIPREDRNSEMRTGSANSSSTAYPPLKRVETPSSPCL